jgi:hypothetical protein
LANIELYIGDARFDDWEVIRDFGDLETAQAFCQLLDEQGFDAVITSDYDLDQYHRGDIALRVPPDQWSGAEDALGDTD